MKKVAFKVLGCKVNSFEIEGIKNDFIKVGYEITNDITEHADVYVINTCTVTNTADKKSRQAIRRCIKHNPEGIIAVIGCYSQLKSQEAQGIEGVDIVLGTQNRNELVNYVEQFRKNRKPIVNVENIMEQKSFESFQTVKFQDKTRAFLKIQEGCNNFCTFCIIPWARGLMRSEKPENILKQVNDLVQSGIKEIVLTGIHTGGYGEDLEDYNFVDLLNDLEKVEGLKRIRISSIEITQLTSEFMEYFTNSKKIVNHLHIPIQSGDDEILKKMRRNYTLFEFGEKLKQIRKINPNVGISTDVIVGFPGETDEKFENTCNTIKKFKINNLHVFPYSKRNGTPAAKMEDQVEETIKKERVKRLIQIGHEINNEYQSNFINQELEVLIESKHNNSYIGYTPNYIKVNVSSTGLEKNELVNVKITKILDDKVYGERII